MPPRYWRFIGFLHCPDRLSSLGVGRRAALFWVTPRQFGTTGSQRVSALEPVEETPHRANVAPVQRTTGQRVRRAYIFALGITAALSVGAFVALDGFISKQGSAASIISMAGRQLTLSQRIVGFTQSLIRRDVNSTNNKPAVARDLHFLETAIAEMENAHQSLVIGDESRDLPGITSPKERDLYESAPTLVNQRLGYFLQDARKVLDDPGNPVAAAAADRILREAHGGLSRALNAVVTHHEQLARQHATQAQQVHLALLIATLLVLLAEGLFIFRPLARSLAKTERELDSKCDELVHQSSHDPLTGVMNRRGLKHVLDRKCQGGDLTGHAVLMLDLDNFKIINDTYGHDVGDELLRKVAAALASNLDDDDICIRMGGDEFLIIASLQNRRDTAASQEDGGSDDIELVVAFADRLITDLKRGRSGNPRTDLPSVSIGIACGPEHGSGFDTMLANADLALYRAKSGGRDRIACYDPKFRNHHESVQQQETMVRNALERGAFEPYFQPQIDMRNGKVIGIEALARCRDENGDIVSPAQFIDVAEQSRLIVPIGKIVIEKAIRTAAQWLNSGMDFGQVSINVSAAQLHDPEFVDFLDRTLDAAGYPAGLLAVEVLETVLLDERNENIVDVCKSIKALGASIELDDFGVGYASIGNIDRIGVDRIKIDRSLLKQPINSKSRDVLGAMISVARSLQLDVLAEGVETAEHEARLLALGCHKVQGFRFARPMSADGFLDWFEERHGEQQDAPAISNANCMINHRQLARAFRQASFAMIRSDSPVPDRAMTRRPE